MVRVSASCSSLPMVGSWRSQRDLHKATLTRCLQAALGTQKLCHQPPRWTSLWFWGAVSTAVPVPPCCGVCEATSWSWSPGGPSGCIFAKEGPGVRTWKGLRARSFRCVTGKRGAGLFEAEVENSPRVAGAGPCQAFDARGRRFVPGSPRPRRAGSSGSLSFLPEHVAALWVVKTRPPLP